MILFMYSLLMSSFTLTIYLATTPISLGINILMMALLLSCLFSSILSSWFGFLIFLVYVGGMLIMFSYFMALTPNQQVGPIFNFPVFILSLLTLFFIALVTNMGEMTNMSFIEGFTFLYSWSNILVLVLFVLVLLFIMVIVVKLTTRTKGPLRPFMYV